MTKKESQMLSGFIKVLKNNNYSDEDIYNLIDEYVAKFGDLKNKKTYTTKGKPHTIGVRPNIKDLLYCRDEIINMIKQVSKLKTPPDVKVDWSKERLEDTEKW